eukprot:1190173-Rhodomonas_salina.1
MSGTHPRYGPLCSYALAMPCLVLSYAMSGTLLGHAPTRSLCSAQYWATRALRGVRYSHSVWAQAERSTEAQALTASQVPTLCPVVA